MGYNFILFIMAAGSSRVLSAHDVSNVVDEDMSPDEYKDDELYWTILMFLILTKRLMWIVMFILI